MEECILFLLKTAQRLGAKVIDSVIFVEVGQILTTSQECGSILNAWTEIILCI
jgi:hypothetical protein